MTACENCDSLAAQVVALREALRAYHPGCDAKALCSADRALADTAAVAAEWLRQERLAGASQAIARMRILMVQRFGSDGAPKYARESYDSDAAYVLQAMEAEASQDGQA